MKNVRTLCLRFFLDKLARTYKKIRGEMLCKFAGKPSLRWNLKLCNFITSWKMMNALTANPTKRSSALKQFVGESRRIVWVCLTTLIFKQLNRHKTLYKVLTLQKQPPEVFYRNCCSLKLTNSKGKHLCQSLFCTNVAGLRPAILFKKRLWHRYFSVNFAKFLRTLFLQNTSGRLLLLNKINKNIRRQGWNFGLRSPLNMFLITSRLEK